MLWDRKTLAPSAWRPAARDAMPLRREKSMVFYEISAHAHPFYFWARPKPYPADPYKLACAKRTPRNPPRFIIEHGWKTGHVIWDNIWSEELIEVLEQCKATGYATYPVKVTRRRKPVHGYVGVRVFGKGGPFDPIRSRAEYFESGGILGYQGVYMDEKKWDGSDVFTIPGLGIGVYVVKRVAKELQRLKLKNMSLVKNTECALP